MDDHDYQADLSKQVSKKEQRKIKAREQGRSIWYGLGMFGLIGWSIAVPTLIGIAIGIWIDRTYPSKFSCTLMCLFIGLVVGCSIAWRWMKQEGLWPADSEDSCQRPDGDKDSRGRGT